MQNEYEVEPKSRYEIRRLTHQLRIKLQLFQELYFPIVELLDVLDEMYDDFSYEIVEDKELDKTIHADTDVRTGHIRIKESVYNGACDGNGRDRMTIAHEIGHYILLCVYGFKFHRKFSSENTPAYKSPEWQAKCFAGELLMNNRLIQNFTIEEIVEKCGVSSKAAEYHYNLLHSVNKKCA